MSAYRNVNILLLAIAITLCVTVPRGNAEVIVAASAAYADVSEAVTSAQSGDTVVVPDGSVTWNSTLYITKGITLQGAGAENTVITNGQGKTNQYIIRISPANPKIDVLIRVTGFTFDGEFSGGGIGVSNGSNDLVEKIRIDHNRFFECNSRAINWQGFVHGLADSNEFVDCYIIGGVYGDYWNSWELIPVQLGSTNYVVYEDNTVSTTGSRRVTFCMHAGQGGRYTFRYNTVNWKDAGNYYEICDAHGNQEPVTEENRDGHRGTVCTEIYGNEINGPTTRSSRFFYHRGGISIVFNNIITGGNSVAWQMTEEDGWRFGFLSKWPGYDRVKESYFWNNTLNGKLFTPTLNSPADDAVFIQEGRDYFLFEKPGYIPLQYPHPLRDQDGHGQSDSPVAPSGLRISS